MLLNLFITHGTYKCRVSLCICTHLECLCLFIILCLKYIDKET